MSKRTEKEGLTYGYIVAGLIEEYCEEREGYKDNPSRLIAAKEELAARLDEVFTEMVPQSLDDIL